MLGIRNETERMKVTPPLAVAPLAPEDDMRWNPGDDGIYPASTLYASRVLRARALRQARSRNVAGRSVA